MLSPVSLCNQALTLLGQTRYITSLTETSVEARVLNLHYDQARRSLFEAYPWRFAQVNKVLPMMAIEESVTPWEYAYALPANAVQVLRVYHSDKIQSVDDQTAIYPNEVKPDYRGNIYPGEDFEMGYSSGGKILYCNIENACATLVAELEDPLTWPAAFAEAFTYKLALTIAPALSGGNMGKRDQLMPYYQAAFSKAAVDDANEGTQTAPDWSSAYVESRSW